MKPTPRERARVLSEYIDSLVIHRRIEQDTGVETDEDLESRDLRRLASDLSGVGLVPPDEFAGRLTRELARSARARRRDEALLPRLGAALRPWHWMGRRRAPSIRLLAGTVAALLLLFMYPEPSSRVSAAHVLTQAQAAVEQLVRPGELMLRRWRIVDRIREQPGAPERTEVRYLLEWMHGSDSRTAAGRSLDADGRLYLAYVNEPSEGLAPRVYYEPGFADEPKGLLSIVPTRAEFEAAAAGFHRSMHAMLFQFLARGYVPYQPILGELRYNETILDAPDTSSRIMPQELSVETYTNEQGKQVHRVRFVDPVRVQFRWRGEGPPKAWLVHEEIVRYVAADTYLTIKTETTQQHEGGRQIFSSRELQETRIVNASLLDHDPFAIDVPADVPVRRQSAFEHLTQVGAALKRSPAFLGLPARYTDEDRKR